MPSWFDSYSTGDSDLAKVSQIESPRASVSHVRSVLASETERLGGWSEHIYLCGISQEEQLEFGLCFSNPRTES